MVFKGTGEYAEIVQIRLEGAMEDLG